MESVELNMIDVVSVVSLIASVASVALAICAIWFSWFFYSLSQATSKATDEALKEIVIEVRK